LREAKEREKLAQEPENGIFPDSHPEREEKKKGERRGGSRVASTMAFYHLGKGGKTKLRPHRGLYIIASCRREKEKEEKNLSMKRMGV